MHEPGVEIAFGYEIMWEREEELGLVIEKAWLRRNPGSDLGALSTDLMVITKDLKTWAEKSLVM